MKHLLLISLILLLAALFAAGCAKDWIEDPDAKVYKVAVLMRESEKGRWQETARWAQENIFNAQKGLDQRVRLELTFYNQDAADIDAYMHRIAQDQSVMAIIGPATSDRAEQLADILEKLEENNKPMITPAATYVQYQRKVADNPYVWNLAESDITELEVLIAEIAEQKLDSPLELLVMDQADKTGDALHDYAEWFSFIAEEYGLRVQDIHFYTGKDDLPARMGEICNSGKEPPVLVFSAANEQYALLFDSELKKYSGKPRRIYCTDSFVTEKIAAGVKNYDYEGVDIYASPESGFIQAYQDRFGREPENGEAQLFDAVYMLSYAAAFQMHSGGSLNDALLEVVEGRSGTGGGWRASEMTSNYMALTQGICPNLRGVSSEWSFDKLSHSSVVGSTYRIWRLEKGAFKAQEYVSTEGSAHSSSTKEIWEWTASSYQTFDAGDGAGLTYPPVDKRWALLVAGSSGWINYRFQADVFAMYQILRRHGYPDDHIVVVCEDDLARDRENPHPGELRVREDGPNLYEPAAVDYIASTISADDIGAILQGRSSERLPHVLQLDEDDNVFIFWSSHGSKGKLYLGNSPLMTYETFRSILSDTPHRKLLMAVEACYGGGLGEACEGLPGCLFITAANPYETSHSAVWSDLYYTYLSNGFTKGFQEAIDQSPTISLRDLYYTLASHTAGSHVKVYNAPCYGNVYSETMGEYLPVLPRRSFFRK